jgi:DNA-binding GntR family transcriptional regulator
MSRIYEQLKHMIVFGELDPHAPLTELGLAARFDVSRTPIREALRQLEHDGLVERVGRTLRIRVRTPEEIFENYEVRVVLETLVARSAALRCSEFDLTRLEIIHEQMLSYNGREFPVMSSLNHQFRAALRKASGNRTLEMMIEQLNSQVRGYNSSPLLSPHRWESVLQSCGELLGAIRDHDPERAADVVARQMTEARDERLRILAAETG